MEDDTSAPGLSGLGHGQVRDPRPLGTRSLYGSGTDDGEGGTRDGGKPVVYVGTHFYKDYDRSQEK